MNENNLKIIQDHFKSNNPAIGRYYIPEFDISVVSLSLEMHYPEYEENWISCSGFIKILNK